MRLRRRIPALVIQCSLLLGWFVAPAADAWVYHRAGAVPRPHAEAYLDTVPAHNLTNCAVVLAATVPQGLPACAPAITVVQTEISKAVVPDPVPPLRSRIALQPPTRAPPAR